MAYYYEDYGQNYPDFNYNRYDPPHRYHSQLRSYAPSNFYSDYPSSSRHGWKPSRMKTPQQTRPRRHSAHYYYRPPPFSFHMATHQDPIMFQDQRPTRKKKNRPRSSSTGAPLNTNSTPGPQQTNNNDVSTNANLEEETESLNSLEILAKENSKINEQLGGTTSVSSPLSSAEDIIPIHPTSNNEPLEQQTLTTGDSSPVSKEIQQGDRSVPSTTSSHYHLKHKSRRWSFFDLFRKPSPFSYTSTPTPADLERFHDTAKVAKMDHIWCFKTSDSPARIVWTGLDYNNQVLLTDHANDNELVLTDSHICQGSLPFLVVLSQQLAYYLGTNNVIEKAEIKCLPNTKDTIVLRKRFLG